METYILLFLFIILGILWLKFTFSRISSTCFIHHWTIIPESGYLEKGSMTSLSDIYTYDKVCIKCGKLKDKAVRAKKKDQRKREKLEEKLKRAREIYYEEVL